MERGFVPAEAGKEQLARAIGSRAPCFFFIDFVSHRGLDESRFQALLAE
ncbi:hypothetical protein [Nannocystis exedens]|nr:hypothetical protein [Nannocystis exedens]